MTANATTPSENCPLGSATDENKCSSEQIKSKLGQQIFTTRSWTPALNQRVIEAEIVTEP